MSTPLLIYQAPDDELATDFVDGLWLTDEAVGVVVNHPNFKTAYGVAAQDIGIALLGDDSTGHEASRLVVWLGSHYQRICFDDRVVRPAPQIIPFTGGIYGDSYHPYHKYIFVHKPCPLLDALQTLRDTERGKSNVQRCADLTRSVAFAVVADAFLPSLHFEDAFNGQPRP